MSFPLPDQYISEGEWEGIRRNFDAIAALVLDTGGRSLGIRVGTGVWTWPGGSTVSNLTTVSHGLGRTPVFAGAFAAADQGAGEMLKGSAVAPSSTTFGSRGEFRALLMAAAGTANFYWVAIG